MTNSIFSLDVLPQSQFELNELKSNYFGWVTVFENYRFAITDENGVAQFNYLSAWDITGENATWKFYFAAGDRHSGLYLTTNLTTLSHTYISSSTFEIIEEPSKFISAKTYFATSPEIRLTSKVSRSFYLLNVHLTELDNIQIYDTPYSDITTKLLDNTICYLYYNGEEWKTQFDCIGKKITSKIPNTHQFEVEFKKLQWSQYGFQSNIRLSIASFLQHNTTSEAITQFVSIESTANSINFISDPPQKVLVNQVFKVELSVKINGGTPLPKAQVDWNVTKAFDLSKLTSEIFTSLGNTNYNIQKSGLLAQSSKLDEDRSSGITDRNGTAKIYLRIKESPPNSKVRIVCQCGKVVSSPSRTITIDHSIAKLTQERNYEETVKVKFNKNTNEYLSKLV